MEQFSVKIILFLNVVAVLKNNVEMLWQRCLNVVVWLEFNVGHQRSHNIAWTLSFGHNSMLDINVDITLSECYVNVVI